MADANTMLRCIIGDDEKKIKELQEIRASQKILYTLEVLAYHQLQGITIYSYDQKLMKAVNRFEL